MFDKITTTHAAPAYPQEVHHHLAPTAEHMRLLMEMQNEVKLEILFRDNPKDNIFGVLCVVSLKETQQYSLRFSLNGKQYSVNVPDNDILSLYKQEDFKKLLASMIAEAIVGQTEIIYG